MRIVDKRKDYYDCMQGMGQDQSLQYIRTETIIQKNYSLGSLKQLWIGNTKVNLFITPIIFCNKYYPCYEFRLSENRKTADIIVYCYSLEDIDAFVDKYFPKFSQEYRLTNNRYDRRRLTDWPWDWKRYTFESYFKRMEEDHPSAAVSKKTLSQWGLIDKPIAYFCNHDYPAKIISKFNKEEHTRGIIVVNGILSQFNFQKIFSPPQAYQEIQMFLANIATPMKPIPHVSDEDLIGAKGFDKFSFRRDKSK